MSAAERAFFYNSQHFIFRVRQLYKNNKTLFNEMVDYLPYTLFINKKDSLDIIYSSKELSSKSDELENLIVNGFSYLKSISCPVLYNIAVEKALQFKTLNDKDAVLPYLQSLQVNGEMKYFYASKIILDNDLYINSGFFTEEMGVLGKVVEKVFEPIENSQQNWLRFQSLTKREKEILRLVAEGNSNKEISDLLFLSLHSVHTHRKNIYRKLDINKTSQLVQFAMLLEIF